MTELDLTTQEPRASSAPITPLDQSLGDSAAMEGWTRITLAGGLVGLLMVLTVGSGLYIAIYPSKEPALESFLKLVFTPIVGLVGSVVGFYFGARTAAGNNNS